jgi:hypothetical protein
LIRIYYFRGVLINLPLKTILFLLTAVFSLCLITSCEKLIDQKKVIGTWVIRKDSSEMKLVITDDSVQIGYEPGNTMSSYHYMWKQDEDRGLMECYRIVPLDSQKLAVKIIPSKMYISRVSSDSLSVFIPALKTKFDFKREEKLK